jgi:membrane protein implicated in regulation of membrane protease activity
MDFLAAPELRPFAVAGLVMLLLVVLEIGSTLVGFSLGDAVDKGVEADGDPGVLGGMLGWVNAGGVPTMVLLLILLGGFSAFGFALQAAAEALWTPLPAFPASLLAFLPTIPFTRAASRGVARIVPRDETYAVSADDLVGRVAEVTVGPLDAGPAGRVKLRDSHGNWHFPLARAARGEAPIGVGAQVLLVDRDGAAYLAIPVPPELNQAG